MICVQQCITVNTMQYILSTVDINYTSSLRKRSESKGL